MEWNKKVEMITLANNDKTEEFRAFVLANVQDFDTQSWNMFINAIEFKNDKETRVFVDKIKEHWLKVESQIVPNLGFRELLRFEALKDISILFKDKKNYE